MVRVFSIKKVKCQHNDIGVFSRGLARCMYQQKSNGICKGWSFYTGAASFPIIYQPYIRPNPTSQHNSIGVLSQGRRLVICTDRNLIESVRGGFSISEAACLSRINSKAKDLVLKCQHNVICVFSQWNWLLMLQKSIRSCKGWSFYIRDLVGALDESISLTLDVVFQCSLNYIGLFS